MLKAYMGYDRQAGSEEGACLSGADGKTVETGSFDCSSAAECYNSENAVVIRNAPAFAAAFQRRWQSGWNDSTPYRPGN